MTDASEDILDEDYEPSVEPKSSKAWLNILRDAEKVFEDYQRRADKIDKLYADLGYLAQATREREFALFWSNIQVLGPSIYSRPPVPVVVPKFKDRRPLYRVSSELLERSTNVAFDLTDIDSVMLLLRDDLTIVGRGASWVRYETKQDSDTATERVCIEHVDRKDFLHDPARKWSEVGWVAKRSWLTKTEMRKRFQKTSGKAYQNAEYEVQKEDRENGGADNRRKAGVWEIWSKTENRVVWVAEGCEKLLDDDKPHLKLEGFFPCPKPAYATVQRRSLIPVPDMVYYKDQLEEINELTGRIHAISQSLRVRGFYPAGTGEIGDAIEAALKSNDERSVVIPISNWAAFGGTTSPKDTIVWMPIAEIAEVVAGLVELRRQVIDDVYQIMGLSDIMRGSTEKDETLGAQQLKAQFGSVRIRDKQAELVRIARDCVRIAAEIMAENFNSKTLLEMSQMEIPTDADIKRQVGEIKQQMEAITAQVEQAQADPQIMQQAQQDPEQAQQMLQQAQSQIEQLGQQGQKLQEQPTVEKVMAFLRDQRIRPFVLDIETDSTIAPDEQAEKEARTEFVTALGGMIQQFTPMVQTMPQAAGMVGEMIKFALAPYRAGRELEGKIDEAIEMMIAQANQPQPNPEAEAAKAESEARMQEIDRKAQIEMAKIDAKREADREQSAAKARESDAKLQAIQVKADQDQQKGEMEIRKLGIEMQKMREEIEVMREKAQIDAAAKQQQAQISAQSAQQQADIKAQAAEQQAQHSEQAFVQQSEIARQKAAQPQGVR